MLTKTYPSIFLSKSYNHTLIYLYLLIYIPTYTYSFCGITFQFLNPVVHTFLLLSSLNNMLKKSPPSLVRLLIIIGQPLHSSHQSLCSVDQPPADEHLHCFHICVFTNEAGINILVCLVRQYRITLESLHSRARLLLALIPGCTIY